MENIDKMLDPDNEHMQVIFGEKGDNTGGFTKMEGNENLIDDFTPMRPNRDELGDIWGETVNFTTVNQNANPFDSTLNDSGMPNDFALNGISRMEDISNLPMNGMEADEPSVNISNPVMQAILGRNESRQHVVVDDDEDALGMEEVPDWEDNFHYGQADYGMQRVDKWKLNKDGVIAMKKNLFKKEADTNTTKEKRPRQEPMGIPSLRNVMEWCARMERKAGKAKNNADRLREDADMAEFVTQMEEMALRGESAFHADLLRRKNKVFVEEPNFDTFQTLPGYKPHLDKTSERQNTDEM